MKKKETMQQLLNQITALLENLTRVTYAKCKMESGEEWESIAFTEHPAYRHSYMAALVDLHSGITVEFFREEIKIAESNGEYERCAGLKRALEFYISAHPQTPLKNQSD